MRSMPNGSKHGKSNKPRHPNFAADRGDVVLRGSRRLVLKFDEMSLDRWAKLAMLIAISSTLLRSTTARATGKSPWPSTKNSCRSTKKARCLTGQLNPA